MREVTKIILHCSASDDPKQTAAMIDQWHKARGFAKIGYHYFIRFDGTIERGRGLEEIGAHAEGCNKDSVGICLAGLKFFTTAQFDSLSRVLGRLKYLYPKATVHGHCEFSNKSCPVFDYSRFKKEYEWTGTNSLLKTFLKLCKLLLHLLGRLKS